LDTTGTTTTTEEVEEKDVADELAGEQVMGRVEVIIQDQGFEQVAMGWDFGDRMSLLARWGFYEV